MRFASWFVWMLATSKNPLLRWISWPFRFNLRLGKIVLRSHGISCADI